MHTHTHLLIISGSIWTFQSDLFNFNESAEFSPASCSSPLIPSLPLSPGGWQGGRWQPAGRCQRRRACTGQSEGFWEVAEAAVLSESSDEVLPGEMDHRQHAATGQRWEEWHEDLRLSVTWGESTKSLNWSMALTHECQSPCRLSWSVDLRVKYREIIWSHRLIYQKRLHPRSPLILSTNLNALSVASCALLFICLLTLSLKGKQMHRGRNHKTV